MLVYSRAGIRRIYLLSCVVYTGRMANMATKTQTFQNSDALQTYLQKICDVLACSDWKVEIVDGKYNLSIRFEVD